MPLTPMRLPNVLIRATATASASLPTVPTHSPTLPLAKTLAKTGSFLSTNVRDCVLVSCSVVLCVSEVLSVLNKPKYTANVASLSLSLSPSLNDEDWREILNEVKSHEPKN